MFSPNDRFNIFMLRFQNIFQNISHRYDIYQRVKMLVLTTLNSCSYLLYIQIMLPRVHFRLKEKLYYSNPVYLCSLYLQKVSQVMWAFLSYKDLVKFFYIIESPDWIKNVNIFLHKNHHWHAIKYRSTVRLQWLLFFFYFYLTYVSYKHMYIHIVMYLTIFWWCRILSVWFYKYHLFTRFIFKKISASQVLP